MSESLNERLNKILPRVISDGFLSGSGIGNEVAFYVFDYPPEDELKVRDYLRTLVEHIPKQKHGLRVKHLNLFDLVLEYLRGRHLLDKAIQVQREKGDEALKRALAGPLHETKMSSVFAEASGSERFVEVWFSRLITHFRAVVVAVELNKAVNRHQDFAVAFFRAVSGFRKASPGILSALLCRKSALR
jgi:hypothetical protein